MLPLGRAILPHHPGKVLAVPGPQPCVRQSLDRAEGGGGTRSCGVASKPGSPLHFLEKQRHQIPPIFSDPLFIPSMAKVVFKVVKPPVVLKALPSTSSREVPSAPNQPADGGPELEVSEPKESIPSTSQPCQQVLEQFSEASNTDSDKADEPPPPQKRNNLIKVSKSNFPLDS